MSPSARIPVPDRRGVIAALVALWLGLVILASWEPLLGDGWDFETWIARHGSSPRSFLEFCSWSYREDNPRLGQMLGFLTYVEPLHVVLTPLVELGVIVLIFTLASGRRPGHSGDGTRLVAVAAVVLLVTPQIGIVLFYRPFTTNYVYPLLVQLTWALPYRLALGEPALGEPPPPGQARGLVVAAGMFVLGVMAGMGNEHTGLPWIGFGAAALWCTSRRRLWMVTGVIGVAAGYAALLLAPGQERRYAGLAGDYSPLDAIWARGLGGNLAAIASPALVVATLLALTALATLAARRAPVTTAASDRPLAPRWWLATAVALSLFALLGPKVGGRMHVAAALVAAIAVLPLVWRALATTRGAWVRAVAILVVAGHALLFGHIYRRAHRECLARYRLLAAAPPGSTPEVAPLSDVQPTRWFRGDDFRSPDLRRRVARGHFRLKDIVVRGLPATLWEYSLEVSPASAAPPPLDFPLDIAKARQAFSDVIAGMRPAPERAVLSVVGWSLPEQRGRPLLVDRAGAGLARAPRARLSWDGLDRSVHLVDDRDVTELWIAIPGEPARPVARLGPGRFQFPVWRASTYTLVACTADTCFLVLAQYDGAT